MLPHDKGEAEQHDILAGVLFKKCIETSKIDIVLLVQQIGGVVTEHGKAQHSRSARGKQGPIFDHGWTVYYQEGQALVAGKR